MKHIRFVTLIAALLMFCMFFSGCNSTPIDIDATLMHVDGEEITMEEFRYYYLTLKKQIGQGNDSYWANNPDAEKGLKNYAESYIIENMAIDKLLAENNYTATEEEKKAVNDSVAELRAQCKSEEEFQKLLANNYMTEEIYREMMLRSKMTYRFLYDFNMENNAEAMEKQKELYVRVKHVLVKSEGRTLEKALEIAEEVVKKARAGEDFDKLVKEYNEDPGMVDNTVGYYFTHKQMLEEFEKASYALKEGEVSDPVKTTHGYHVIIRLPMEEAHLKDQFSSIFGDDEFYTRFDEKVQEIIDGMNITYEGVYNNVNVNTVV